MADNVYASGRWTVRPGEEQNFEARWSELLAWSKEEYGSDLLSATLLSSDREDTLYISLAVWSTADARRNWQQSEGFAERFGVCRDLCDDFDGGDYSHVASY